MGGPRGSVLPLQVRRRERRCSSRGQPRHDQLDRAPPSAYTSRLMPKRTAIYPGSFDPLTNGHLAIIQRGLKVFDRLVVAVANNPQKAPMFSVDERKTMLAEAVGDDTRVEVDSFEGLLVDYC